MYILKVPKITFNANYFVAASHLLQACGTVSNRHCTSVTQQELLTKIGNGFILDFGNGGKVTVILREEHSLRLLQEIFGTAWEKCEKVWKKLHNDEPSQILLLA